MATKQRSQPRHAQGNFAEDFQLSDNYLWVSALICTLGRERVWGSGPPPIADNQNGAANEEATFKVSERHVRRSKPARCENSRRKRPSRLGMDNVRNPLPDISHKFAFR